MLIRFVLILLPLMGFTFHPVGHADDKDVGGSIIIVDQDSVPEDFHTIQLPERPVKQERPKIPERPEIQELPEKPERPVKPERPNIPERPEIPELPERPGRG